jgi:putative photosynthetic complex assembly protein 2
MIEHIAPIIFALFLWWFATGVIVYLDGLPRRTFSLTFLGASILLGLALVGLGQSANDTSITGAYVAFASGLIIWAWLEMAFYMGFITGPNKSPCPEGCSEVERFMYAVGTVAWNLLASLIAIAAIMAVVWNAPNHIALWTFVVLFWMQQSAKLNVFLGVRNLNLDFLPAHLGYLASFMRERPINLFFPVSVTVSTIVCVWIIQVAHAPGTTTAEAVGLALVATMLSLAILEHWFLILPIPAEKLWSWSLVSHHEPPRSPLRGRQQDVEAVQLGDLTGTCDSHALQSVLQTAARGDFGRISKLEGTLRNGSQWVRFDLCHGDVRLDAIQADRAMRCEAKVTGQAIDLDALRQAFANCVQRPSVAASRQSLA